MADLTVPVECVRSLEEESILYSVLDQLWSSRTLRLTLRAPLCVAVVAVGRYLSDAQAADGAGGSYVYDVTITDGKWQVKCHLASGLNHLVHKNTLRCGRCVHVAQFALVYDETRLGQNLICIEKVKCAAEGSDVLLSVKDLNSLRWWSRDNTGTDVPLKRNRKHYLSLWNNEDPHGSVWMPNGPPPDVVIDASRISLLGDLDAFFSGSRRPLPLLVRVLHKSRLRYYGKPGQNIAFPFQAYFEVADQSGIMSVVLWNDLCLQWYQRLAVGSVLYLQHYTLKRSYQNRSRPQMGHLPLLTFHTTEICLNPRNPSAIVTVIPPRSVQPQWSLPEVTFNFYTRSEIEGLASNQACDIICLVMYVGRVERIRNKGNLVPEKFWTYRWVQAVDGTSDSPFILEIFASSQPKIFNNICPMTYLVCTQMRVCREAGSSLYLTSSAETQLFITGCHRKQPYVSDPKVKTFIQWTKTLKENVVLRKTRVGGHYCYPPPPPTYTPPTSTGTSQTCETSPSLMAVTDLQRELEILQYREHRRIAIQGTITAVHYHSWPQEAPQSGANTAQGTPCRTQQLESGTVYAARGPVSLSSTAPPSGRAASFKRRKTNQGTMDVQIQYWTRAKVQSESSPESENTSPPQQCPPAQSCCHQTVPRFCSAHCGKPKGCHEYQQEKLADLQEDEEEGESAGQCDDEESEEGHSSLANITESPQTTANREPARTGALHPSASWESSVWASLKQDVLYHVCCGSLHRESLPEKFRYDDRDDLLHRICLSPSTWSPDAPSDSVQDACTLQDGSGYFTVTVLGLNQQAAVDAIVVPVFSSDDPRTVGMPAPGLYDNTLMSLLSFGGICAQTNGSYTSPEGLLSSAPALDGEKVVCVLDVCLLGPDEVELMCCKVYQTSHVAPVYSTPAQ